MFVQVLAEIPDIPSIPEFEMYNETDSNSSSMVLTPMPIQHIRSPSHMIIDPAELRAVEMETIEQSIVSSDEVMEDSKLMNGRNSDASELNLEEIQAAEAVDAPSAESRRPTRRLRRQQSRPDQGSHNRPRPTRTSEEV